MKALEMKKSTMVGTTARTMVESVSRTVSLEPKIPARERRISCQPIATTVPKSVMTRKTLRIRRTG